LKYVLSSVIIDFFVLHRLDLIDMSAPPPQYTVSNQVIHSASVFALALYHVYSVAA